VSRPTKLTAEIQDAFIKALMVGAPPETAARKAGFSPPTMYRWLRGTSPEQLAFREAHDQALAEVESRLAMTLFKASLTQPRWALELLTRRFPARWGRPQAIVVDAPAYDSGPAEAVVVLRPELVATLVPQLLAAGRAVSGRSTTEALDIGEFEDDGFPDEPDGSDAEPTAEVPES
jgi:hypothetical protein